MKDFLPSYVKRGVTMVFVTEVHVLSVCIELKESECAEKERE